ncbi:DDB1- and CUL4-associated factor 4 [Hydra vulgaris]|uniref:DDB1- and CUL4-associated factor 4 n=1 Tax=Hydra vulgaris TaxID=6087 RepID=A0ABM4BHY1_HYDVU
MNREIPGFYFDTVKKKYFKITKDFKKPKPSPEKRLSFKRGCTLFDKLQLRSVFLNQRNSVLKASQLHLFNQIYMGNWKNAKCIPLEFSSSLFTAKKVSVCPFGQIVVIFSRQDKDECLSIIDANCTNNSLIHFSLKDVFSLGNFRGQCLAWSPFQEGHFVYSGVGTFSQNSFVNLCKPLSNTHITLYQDFKNIGYNSVGWSSYDQSVIGVGAHNSTIYLHDIIKRNFISTYKVNSSIQAIQFSKKQPCFFTGCQCGFLYQIDYRSKNKICVLDNSSRLCCIDSIKLLNDENYIILSDLGGKLIKTDIRMKRCITEYIGHINNYYPLDFYIDSYENFLFTIGSDSYIRVWDIKSSQLEISVCVQGTSKSLEKPCITYSPNLCKNYDYGALLCCFENKFQIWPLV